MRPNTARRVLSNVPQTSSPKGTVSTPQETQVFQSIYASGEFPGDVRSQQAIQDDFDQFKKRIDDLKAEFGKFSRECRQLGRSYALISAVRELENELDTMLSVFEENMKELSRLPRESHSVRNESVAMSSHTTKTAASFERVAAAFESFRERLNEFRDHTDENAKFKALIKIFEGDLKYRAFCLRTYDDRYNPINMRLFIHGLTQEVKNDLDEILSALKFLNTYGVPAMQYEQKRNSESVLNMATVATFFSAVTATTLQMSVGIQGESLPSTVIIIVNTFWFCSLVLSIGAALNSLMAAAWKSTTYGTRGRRLPLWAKVTSVLTLITTVITSFGFVTVASWIVYEQWIAPNLPRLPWPHSHKQQPGNQKLGPVQDTSPSRPVVRRTRTDSISEYSLASTESDESGFNITNLISGLKSLALPELSHSPSDPESQMVQNESEPDETSAKGRDPQKSWTAGARAISFQSLVTKEFWRKTPLAVPRMSLPTRSGSVPRIGEKTTPISDIPPLSEISTEPSCHAVGTGLGAVQDLEFSPDGRLLACTNYDEHDKQSRTVCYVTETYLHTFRFKHSRGRIAKQVAWSTDGAKILTRLDHHIDILDSQCKLLASIKRPHRIESAVWCDASAKEVLSVERHIVLKLSIDGTVLIKHRFENILLRDIAAIPGGRLLLAVGRVSIPHDENLPSNSRGEKQLILYDMESREHLSRNPLLDDVRHIALAKRLSMESTSYEVLLGHKNKPPPQLWTLSPHLIGPHRLKPKSGFSQLPGELLGSGYFAGEREEIILCVDDEGNVHVTNRDHCSVIRKVQARVVMNNWRCLAYCPAQRSGSIVFATAGVNEFKIWTVALPAPYSRSDSPETLHASTSSLFSTARPLTIFEEIAPMDPPTDEANNIPGARRISI